jgi:hypothetical protein
MTNKNATVTVTITNKTNNLKSVPITRKQAQVWLAKMLKDWRTDRGNDAFPYWIEAA